MQEITNKSILLKAGTEVIVIGNDQRTGLKRNVPLTLVEDMYVETNGKPFKVSGMLKSDIFGPVVGVALAALLCLILGFFSYAHAASSIGTGQGKLTATAAINFKVVIQPQLGLINNQVISNNEKQTIARSITYDHVDETYFAEDNDPRLKKIGFNSINRDRQPFTYTVSLP